VAKDKAIDENPSTESRYLSFRSLITRFLISSRYAKRAFIEDIFSRDFIKVTTVTEIRASAPILNYWIL
jgi:hypothetical protein